MALHLRYAARSDVGLVRQGNEDSGYAGPHLLVVADGMGGHAAGEVASAAAVDALSRLEPPPPEADPGDLLRDSVRAAGAALRTLVEARPELEGMGTTVTALMQVGDRIGIAQVGDSRAYLLRDGVLEQVTHDQTLVQSWVDEGRISQQEAESHPQRHLMLQALDGRDDVQPEVILRSPRAGDRYLLCSDGLSGVVSDATLRDVLAESEPAEAVNRLVELAMRAGAPDNVTVVVAEVVDGEEPLPRPLMLGAASPTPPSDALADTGSLPSVEPAAEEPEDEEVPPHGHRLWVVLPIVLLVAAVVAGGWFAYRWTQQQYYVGVDEDQVVIFQGVPQRIAGRTISHVVEPSDLDVGLLPAFAREQVEATIRADDLDHARAIVLRLQQQADACANVTPVPAGCPQSGFPAEPGASPGASDTASTTAQSASAGASP